MFVETLVAPITVQSLTPRAVAAITTLDFCPVKQRSDIPAGQGVYVWAANFDAGIWYTGSGSGVNGLLARVGNQLGWAATMAAHLTKFPSLDPLDETSLAYNSVPIVRAIVEQGLTCFAAPVTTELGEPSLSELVTAQQWEKRILTANRTVTGNPSLLGGSAWELKGEHWDKADLWSWETLRRMREENELATR